MDGDILVINGSLVETDKLGEKLDRENYRGRENLGVLYIIASLIKKFLQIHRSQPSSFNFETCYLSTLLLETREIRSKILIQF